MAEVHKTAVTVVAILAIIILVGLVVYFVIEETNDDIEIDFNSQLEREAPAHVSSAGTPLVPPPIP